MILSLEMPFINPSVEGGRVVRWSKRPGESFAYGDELCVIGIEQVVALRKTKTASVLGGSRRRRKRVRDELETRDIGGVRLQLLASEGGTMRQLVIEAGTTMQVGDVLAVLQTADSDDEPIPDTDFDDLPSLRVVAIPFDAEEGSDADL